MEYWNNAVLLKPDERIIHETINQPQLPVENIFIYSNIPLLYHSAVISIYAQTTCLDDRTKYVYPRVESNSYLSGLCDNF